MQTISTSAHTVSFVKKIDIESKYHIHLEGIILYAYTLKTLSTANIYKYTNIDRGSSEIYSINVLGNTAPTSLKSDSKESLMKKVQAVFSSKYGKFSL